MKIVYFLKKGFQFYPPCLAQVLMLNDLGVELEIYHGKNSEYINELFDSRKIKHHELKSDNLEKGKVASAKKMFGYRQEAKKILSGIPRSEVLWFGNCESLLLLGRYLENRQFVASILELYDDKKGIDMLLKKVLPRASVVLCCEKHRSAIMKSSYCLKKAPYVIPNKAYEINESVDESSILNEQLKHTIESCKDKRIVLYQGIISKDRPLAIIAKALESLKNPNVVFWIMGGGDEKVVSEAKSIYKNTFYLGYIPSPQHMLVTKYAHIGIANYDYSNLNNVFCAPNKIYEYAKFGMPMLTSDNVGLTETVGLAGAAVCVDFADIEEVRIGLKTIIDDYTGFSNRAKSFYDMTDNRAVIASICEELKKL